MVDAEKILPLTEIQKVGTVKRDVVYNEVSDVPMPSENNVTLTEEEVLAAYRAHSEFLKYKIQTNTDEICVNNGGTAYYFSSFRGNNNNSGTSPDEPFCDLEVLDSLNLKPFDVVYFERGSFWRRGFTAKVENVTYTAYGTGPKPMMYGSPVDGATYGSWEETDEPNVWVYSHKVHHELELGSIIFNNGESWAPKVVIREESDGKLFDNTTGDPFYSYKDLKRDLHFYYDYFWQTGLIYLRCESGNPAKVFNNIEFNFRKGIVCVEANGVTVDNICFKYTGAHAVSGGTLTDLTVQNCEFYFIGGSILTNGWGRNYATRFGNAVQIYGGCNGYYVRNNYMFQIYDTGITFQYSVPEGKSAQMRNVDVSGNVMDYCNWSFEYFLDGGNPTQSYIRNVNVHNNMLWYAGYGLCEERPDKTDDAHIKGWDHGNSCLGNFLIEDNLFAFAKTQLVHTNASVGNQAPKYSNNIYIQKENSNLGRSKSVKENAKFNKQAAVAAKEMLGDSTAKIIFVK